MRCVIGGDLSRSQEAVEKSGFQVDSGVLLGDASVDGLKAVKCPKSPSAARTAVYLMHIPKGDCVIYIGDCQDDELVTLALSFGKPIYAHYIHEQFTAGLRFNYEEDF